jgi:hypothetical protein
MILGAPRGFFAGDDVVGMTNLKSLDFHAPLPSVVESFDAVRCKNEIDVKRPILQLYEILAAFDLVCLGRRKVKLKIAQSSGCGSTIIYTLCKIHVCVLRGVRETEQNRARPAKK